MNSWIPVSGTPRTRLMEQAMTMFGERGFEGVQVSDVARAAGVTTGALYHHFGSKAGLYHLVRTEVERRVRDRMEGAWAARPGSVAEMLRVGFDTAWELKAVAMLAEVPPFTRDDILADLIAGRGETLHPGLGAILVGAWRAALAASTGAASKEPARSALVALVGGVERAPGLGSGRTGGPHVLRPHRDP
jgi:AcrR family transcriptional regulator